MKILESYLGFLNESSESDDEEKEIKDKWKKIKEKISDETISQIKRIKKDFTSGIKNIDDPKTIIKVKDKTEEFIDKTVEKYEKQMKLAGSLEHKELESLKLKNRMRVAALTSAAGISIGNKAYKQYKEYKKKQEIFSKVNEET